VDTRSQIVNATGVASAPSGRPDITLHLDRDGVIRQASLSPAFPDQDLSSWLGRPWIETITDPGSAKVQRIVRDARDNGVSGFCQLNQRFPSGLELPMEYTAVRLGRRELIVVGKSLQAVAELQSRLIAAQQAMERDYWQIREIETRCRLLFDRSNEAVLLVRASDLRITEANPVAARALDLAAGASATGRDLTEDVPPEEHRTLEAMLQRVRDQGKAPAILLHLGVARTPWLVRASVLPSQEGLSYFLQLTPAAGRDRPAADPVSLENLIANSPDGFVVIDRTGRIQRANRAFLDLLQIGDERSVVREPIGRWLGRPGADATALLASVAAHGSVSHFSTTLQSEFGASAEVELAAAGDAPTEPRAIGILVRNLMTRLPAAAAAGSDAALGAYAGRIGRVTLPQLVKEAVGALERLCIETALRQASGNRTAAAQILGLSRQGLYAKLDRYGMGEVASAATPGSE
jgi:transcriptional regulator PpsR